MPADFEFVKAAAKLLPGSEESTSYGTAAIKVRGKLIARLKEDDKTLVLRLSMEDRDFLLQADPGTFFITDHYRDYPWVLIRLAAAKRAQLRDLLEIAWRSVASKALIAQLEKTRG